MLEFLRGLFGEDRGTHGEDPSDGFDYCPRSTPFSDRYHSLLGELAEVKTARDWDRGAQIATQLIEVMPGFIREWMSDMSHLPPSLPVFGDGALYLALAGNDAGLRKLLELTETHPELGEWKEKAEAAQRDLSEIERLRQLLKERPGILQKDVMDELGSDDGRRIARFLWHMDKGGEIKRIRYKRTYLLAMADVELPLPEDHAARTSEDSSTPTSIATTVKPTFDSNHEKRARLSPRVLNLEHLEYVPLPRAPLRWEERDKKDSSQVPADDHFEVTADTDWKIESVEKLPMEARPDTAYRIMAPHAAGTFLIDDLGRAERFPGSPAALTSVTRDGQVRSQAGLGWGLYRWEVQPLGDGFIAMDEAGVIHAYDHHVRPIFATPLARAPEVPELMAKYEFDEETLKNHTRAVSLSPDREAYLFTVVDSAYAISSNGGSLWSAQLPKKQGWTRVAQVSQQTGTSAQIAKAMDTLGLTMPFTIDDVRSNYRQLAKQWHPDRNAGSPEATERFKTIAWASEMLSGLDPSSLAPEIERAVYTREEAEDVIEVGGVEISLQFGMQTSEKHASDWIYAACLVEDGGAYLAGYSGRIVRTDEEGNPVRAYDIGSVPRRIVDTGDYLYFLTDTRLYVLQGRALVKVMDVFEEGGLVLGQTGFGLLEKKRLRWFTEEGIAIGSILTNNPIRRVYSRKDGLVVETRQRRAIVTGAPPWWE